jgi:hypothetical protein
MKDESYGYLCAGLIGLLMGGVAAYHMEKPASVYARDLNGDNRGDLIIKSKGMRKANVFMQQEDGTYISLSEFGRGPKEENKEEIKLIEEQVKSIQKRADEMK